MQFKPLHSRLVYYIHTIQSDNVSICNSETVQTNIPQMDPPRNVHSVTFTPPQSEMNSQELSIVKSKKRRVFKLTVFHPFIELTAETVAGWGQVHQFTEWAY